MNRFAQKLDQLGQTAKLAKQHDFLSMAAAIKKTRDQPVIAIGSGGSYISAIYFARCRETLFNAPTTVFTPMEFVLSSLEFKNASVWIFSAGANNPDTVAAIEAAAGLNVESIHLITRNVEGTAARKLVEHKCGYLYSLPVDDPKDSFLATHSLVATIGALLLASDQLLDEPIGNKLAINWIEGFTDILSRPYRREWADLTKSLTRDTTLLILSDPQFSTISKLIEISCWEAGLCAVQHTDFRNFGHGRHVWAAHRPEKTCILAITGPESQDSWAQIDKDLPSGLLRLNVNIKSSGRFDNAVGLAHGLAIVEAIGAAVGIDPGKPGIGEFGKEIYANRALLSISNTWRGAIRQKWLKMLKTDEHRDSIPSITKSFHSLLSRLSAAQFGAIVVDYDGTLVTTQDRFHPPNKLILDEVVRLVRNEVQIGIATGRGGSVGEALRACLPKDVHEKLIVGYYNGGFVRPLSVDIREDCPPQNAEILDTIKWLETNIQFVDNYNFRTSPIQLTVERKGLVDPDSFIANIRSCPSIDLGRLSVLSSGHSFDILPTSSAKLSVKAAVKQMLSNPNSRILCIGDSGGAIGNDYDLLCDPFGVSVGDVCGKIPGSWSLWGEEPAGPEATLRVLRSLTRCGIGLVQFDPATLDISRQKSTNREQNESGAIDNAVY